MTKTGIYGNKLDEIRIGILGFKGSGKTTFHAALAYWLYHNTDDEFKHGEPVGVKTREYVDDKIRDLIAGKFPVHTKNDIQLTYRTKYKDSECLVTSCDYNGDETALMHDTENNNSTEMTEFLSQCDAYLIFISIDELLKPDAELPLEVISGVYDILRYYHEKHSKTGKKLRVPMIFCVTKSDTVDIADPKIAEKVEKSFQRFTPRLKDSVLHYDKIFISSIGNDFLDEKGNKRADAQLNPSNILQPFKEVFNIKQNAKSKRVIAKTIILIFIFISIMFVAGFMLKNEADSRILKLKSSTKNIESLSDEELEIKDFEVDDLYENIGIFRALIFDDIERIKQTQLTRISEEQNRRDVLKYQKLVQDSPDKLIELANNNNDSDNENSDKNLEILKKAQKKKDAKSWQIAVNADSVEAYEKYVSDCKEFGTHIEDAQKRILGLKKKSTLQNWNEVIALIEQKPEDFKTIIDEIRKFISQCPYEIRKGIDPLPDKLLEDFIEKWDKRTWREIEDYEKKYVNSNIGKISNIATLIEKYKNYLTRFEQPIQKENADRLIKYYTQISSEKSYKIILTKGEYLGGIKDYESEPDIYVKVLVNGILQFNSIENALTDDLKPRWNKEFTIKWKAYDVVRVEIWDKNLISDTMMCQATLSNLTSAQSMFQNIYYPTKETWKLRVSFEWLGPKR